MIDLVGTVTCVTGASGTIGRGIALRFAEAGSAVAVHHRTDAGSAAAFNGRKLFNFLHARLTLWIRTTTPTRFWGCPSQRNLRSG